MQAEIKELSPSSKELTITVTPKEYQKDLEHAATHISHEHNFEGFRKGAAPYDLVKQKVGETEIMAHAVDHIITKNFLNALKEHKLETVGQPKIDIKKMAPGNDFVFVATVALLPEVTLPSFEDIKIKKETVKIKDTDIDDTLKKLAHSRAAEKLVDRSAGKKDLVKLDYEITLEGVPQEDGKQQDFAAYLGEKHMVPGFEENIVGLSAGDEKKFNVKFPKDYFQKNYAGKTCQFNVKIKGVYELEIPKLDDKFAKSLGTFKNLDELKKQITENMKMEKEQTVEKKNEKAVLDEIIKKTKFSDIPDIMIENEVDAIIEELKHDLSHRGLQFETWLANMNKNIEQFKTDLKPQALDRVKAALVVRSVTDKEKIKIGDKQLDEDIKKLKDLYEADEEAMKQIESPGYRHHLENVLTGQKAMNWLKEKVLIE